MTASRSKFQTLREKFKRLALAWAKFSSSASKHQTENGQELPNILKPVLISGAGRNGSTLLMQLLGTSPQVAFDRVYPFEVRYLTYFLRWSLILNEQWQPNKNWNPVESYKHPNGQAIGPFPYTNAKFWTGTIGKELWTKSFETVWQEFSRTSISKSRENNATGIYLKYYAEKIPTWPLAYLEQQAIPYHVIHLIRDPRDVFLSINAFDQQRGFPGFNRLKDDTDLDFAKRMVQVYRSVYRRKIITSPNSIVVKYEQLATDLPGEAQRLGQWLNTEFNATLVKQQETNFKHHMTSASPEKSVERWRDEMSDELNDFFIQELGEELRYFGYKT